VSTRQPPPHDPRSLCTYCYARIGVCRVCPHCKNVLIQPDPVAESLGRRNAARRISLHTTGKLLNRYIWKMRAERHEGFDINLGVEAYERVKQLDFILQRVARLQRDARLLWRPEYSRLADSPVLRLQFAISIDVEAFYYFAWRLVCILTSKAHPFPRFAGLKAPGINMLRNKLLEHPEQRDSMIFNRSWGYSEWDGPIFKTARPQGSERKFIDTGLYNNALELKAAIEKILAKFDLSRAIAPAEANRLWQEGRKS
jgi:hypothetical protein